MARTIPCNDNNKREIKQNFIVGGKKPEFTNENSNLTRFKETDIETSKPIMLTFKSSVTNFIICLNISLEYYYKPLSMI